MKQHRPILTLSRRASSTERGYDYRWQKAREAYLRLNPLCVMCRARGRVTEATVVDHIIPHRGDPARFWDRTNWASLCKTDHDSTKQRIEKSGRVVGCDANGVPLDPAHPWRQQLENHQQPAPLDRPPSLTRMTAKP